jgi:hypothetical protein
MIRFGIIGYNTLLLKIVSKHLIHKHRFSNYIISKNNMLLNDYGLYVYPHVDNLDKFKRLKDQHFKFITTDETINIPYDYKIQSDDNLHKIFKDLDLIVDKHIFSELV